jgi:hypothetical protein
MIEKKYFGIDRNSTDLLRPRFCMQQSRVVTI